jgi:hypothetical protein
MKRCAFWDLSQTRGARGDLTLADTGDVLAATNGSRTPRLGIEGLFGDQCVSGFLRGMVIVVAAWLLNPHCVRANRPGVTDPKA